MSTVAVQGESAPPQIDVVHESFIAVAPSAVASVVRDPRRWRRWWPDLVLTVFQDRGDRGVRWNVTGALVGSSEVWLEAFKDGVIVHYYLRTSLTAPGSAIARLPADPTVARRSAAEARSRARAAAVVFWDLKDELEGDRRPGTAAVAGAAAAPRA